MTDNNAVAFNAEVRLII